MPLILDTGPIVALLDAGDPEHERCVGMVDRCREDLVIPMPVLIEVDYWLNKLYGPGPWQVLVDDISAGAYRLHHLDEQDLVRAAEIERSYSSLDLGLVDAAVMVTCERLDETKVGTLDRRDFSVVQLRHCEALRLLPEPE